MRLLTVTGPSCAGKDELMKMLVERHNFTTMKTLTTRPRRHGEGDDRCIFVSASEFAGCVARKELIEFAEYDGEMYGTLISELKIAEGSGLVPVKILEPVGLSNITAFAEEAGIDLIRVFVNADEMTLMKRWLERVREASSPNYGAFATRILKTIHVESGWLNSTPYDILADTDMNSPATLAYSIHRLSMLARPTT